MSVRLEAPYGSVAQITFLPNPELADEEGLDVLTIVRKAMDNTLYSYNRRPDDDKKRVSLNFNNIARTKILEIIEFIELYAGGFIRLVDHRNRSWKVILETNPTEFNVDKRASPAGGNESGSFTLVFLGKIVS